MTENEKLLALLAEARAAIHQVIDIDALQGWACESRDGEPSTETLLRHLRQRIDAALAEPVSECARCEETEHAMHLRIRAGYDKTIADSWRAKVAEVERERDEAQAELDFIKSEYGGADNEALTQDALLLKLRLQTSELDGERTARTELERHYGYVVEALTAVGADMYHPEDGEPMPVLAVQRLAKQRDEARSEAEVLRNALAGANNSLAAHISHEVQLRVECSEAQEEAFKRGAEAMREAAAVRIDAEAINGCTGPYFGNIIRALPGPEDKP